MCEEKIPHFDLKLEDEGFMENVRHILKQIRPEWNQDEVKETWFTEGISNKLLGCSLPSLPKKELVLIRVYGNKTELFIDREKELENLKFLHREGFAPPLYATFQNGFCYGFIEGDCLDEETVRDEYLSKQIARLIARLHSVDVSKINEKFREPVLFKCIRQFIDTLPDEFTDPAKASRFLEKCPFPSKQALRDEVAALEPHLTAHDCPMAFCHNDILLKNLIHKDKEVYVIDYEYGGINYTPFDIGNHFNEYAGIDVVDYTRYPKKDHQVNFIRAYLEEEARVKGTEGSVTDQDVERLYVQVNQFALASHMWWGIWGLLQAHFSDIDFDFLDYAFVRFNEYCRRKDEFLSL